MLNWLKKFHFSEDSKGEVVGLETAGTSINSEDMNLDGNNSVY